LIDQKRQEIESLQNSLRDAQTYIQALTDALRSLPKESVPGASEARHDLRPGTMVFRVREVLRERGEPMHISEILAGLNRPMDKGNRVSVSGSLAAYVRNGHIFTRPKPNTFGLVEMASGAADSGTEDADEGLDDLPDSFGT